MNQFTEKICPKCGYAAWYEWSLSVRSYPDCFTNCEHCGAFIMDVPDKKIKDIKKWKTNKKTRPTE